MNRENYPNGYPDSAEIARAQAYLGWAYEGGHDTADQIYAEKYGGKQCWVAEEPDGGLLWAVEMLAEAVWRLEGLEK